MKFIRVLKASDNKHYHIEVSYDYDSDMSQILFEDLQEELTYNNIEIFSNLRDYALSENEQRYTGNKEELIEEGYDLRPIYAYIHSGISLSLGRGGQFSDQFDSGLAGYAAVQGKFTPEQEQALEHYVKSYNIIQDATFYRFDIFDENNDKVYGSGGFMGDSDEEIAQNMFDSIDGEYDISKDAILKALKNPRG